MMDIHRDSGTWTIRMKLGIFIACCLAITGAEDNADKSKDKRGITGFSQPKNEGYNSGGYGYNSGGSMYASSLNLQDLISNGQYGFSGIGSIASQGLLTQSGGAYNLAGSDSGYPLTSGLYAGGYGYGSGYGSKLIGRHITVHNRYAVPVPQPYPVAVHKTVPVHVPHPVRVPVDKPYPVPVPHPVPQPIVKPYPVHIDQPVPVPVPHPVQIRIPRPVPVPIPSPIPVPVEQSHASSQSAPISSLTSSLLGHYSPSLFGTSSGYTQSVPYESLLLSPSYSNGISVQPTSKYTSSSSYLPSLPVTNHGTVSSKSFNTYSITQPTYLAAILSPRGGHYGSNSAIMDAYYSSLAGSNHNSGSYASSILPRSSGQINSFKQYKKW